MSSLWRRSLQPRLAPPRRGLSLPGCKGVALRGSHCLLRHWELLGANSPSPRGGASVCGRDAIHGALVQRGAVAALAHAIDDVFILSTLRDTAASRRALLNESSQERATRVYLPFGSGWALGARRSSRPGYTWVAGRAGRTGRTYSTHWSGRAYRTGRSCKAKRPWRPTKPGFALRSRQALRALWTLVARDALRSLRSDRTRWSFWTRRPRRTCRCVLTSLRDSHTSLTGRPGRAAWSGLPAALHHSPRRVLPGGERRNTGGRVIDHSECETPVSFSSYVVGIVLLPPQGDLHARSRATVHLQ
jgi:hypothetical protein